MAEIYFDIQQFLKSFMVLQQQVIVGCRRLHLGKAFFDAEECTLEISDRNWQHLLNERFPDFAVDDGEKDASS